MRRRPMVLPVVVEV
ncbi:hypothetical protein ABTD73_19290 [Acinetobacter baumannii]